MIQSEISTDTKRNRNHGLPDGLNVLTVMNRFRMTTALKSMVNTYVQDAWKIFIEGMLMTLLGFSLSLHKNSLAILELAEMNKDAAVDVVFIDTGLEFDDSTKDVNQE